MTNAKINGLRSIELGVHDLQKSAEFYRRVWALEDVAAEGDTIHLRGTGREHHVITLRERPRAGAAGRAFLGARPAPRWMRCTPRPRRWAPRSATRRARSSRAPAAATASGSARRKAIRSRSRRTSQRHAEAIDDRSRPTKLTHVVLNSAEVEKQTAFFLDVLGFKWSNSTFMMDFVRCCSDHHSVAFARGNGPTLNHMAYEMPNIDGLMSGAGRVRKSGYEIMWGVGRHGPGSNVFSYFVEPNGFVTEYTTEVEQVDDNYVGHDAKWWKEQNVFPCRWNMAGVPSEFARKAMSGELYEEENQRCEQVMAKALGR